jgi:hypothetical protein
MPSQVLTARLVFNAFVVRLESFEKIATFGVEMILQGFATDFANDGLVAIFSTEDHGIARSARAIIGEYKYPFVEHSEGAKNTGDARELNIALTAFKA